MSRHRQQTCLSLRVRFQACDRCRLDSNTSAGAKVKGPFMCIGIQEHCFLGENVCIHLQYKMKSRDNVMGLENKLPPFAVSL